MILSDPHNTFGSEVLFVHIKDGGGNTEKEVKFSKLMEQVSSAATHL